MLFNYFVPTRFLSLMVQTILSILVYTSMDNNIKAGLWQPTGSISQSAYSALRDQLIAAVSLSLFFNAIEFVGMFSGISTFANQQVIISSLLHITGSILTILFHVETWPAQAFWYVFGFCGLFPFLTECLVWISVLVLKKHF